MHALRDRVNGPRPHYCLAVHDAMFLVCVLRYKSNGINAAHRKVWTEPRGEAGPDLVRHGWIQMIYKIVDMFHRYFFFSSRRRHTRFDCDWSSDVCSSD